MQSWSIFQRAKNKAADFYMNPFHKMTFLDDLVYWKVLSYTKCHPTIFLGETKPTSSRFLRRRKAQVLFTLSFCLFHEGDLRPHGTHLDTFPMPAYHATRITDLCKKNSGDRLWKHHGERQRKDIICLKGWSLGTIKDDHNQLSMLLSHCWSSETAWSSDGLRLCIPNSTKAALIINEGITNLFIHIEWIVIWGHEKPGLRDRVNISDHKVWTDLGLSPYAVVSHCSVYREALCLLPSS